MTSGLVEGIYIQNSGQVNCFMAHVWQLHAYVVLLTWDCAALSIGGASCKDTTSMLPWNEMILWVCIAGHHKHKNESIWEPRVAIMLEAFDLLDVNKLYG